MTEKQEALVKYMNTVIDVRKKCHRSTDVVYFGGEDFVLKHGRWYDPVPMPKGYIKGAPKACFGNALVMAALHGLKYIEGYASIPSMVGMAFHHAWNEDKDGNLIDVTWMNEGTAYIGVEFSIGRADNATWYDNATVLDNPRNRFAILREPWQGENFAKAWRRSKAMKQIL